MRLKIIRLITGGLFRVHCGRVVLYPGHPGEYFFRLSVNNRIRVVPMEGWRGQIKDRNGKVLADNRLSYDVMVTPQEIDDGAALFRFF